MTEPLLTILTPAYNRRHLLPRLYESILRQDVPEGSFEWLVIDDGSTDDTATYLSELAESHPGFIRFETTPNGGKHRALNRGAILARGEWVMVVDSDDWLTEESLRSVADGIKIANKSGGVDVVNGLYVFTQTHEQRKVEVRKNPCSHHEWLLQQAPFDTVYVFRAPVMRSNPFPEIDGEKFMAEGWLYYRLSSGHLTYFTNQPLVRCEYQDDGISAQSRNLRSESPVGAMLVYVELSKFKLTSTRYLKAAVNFWRYYLHARRRAADGRDMQPAFSYFWAPAGYALYFGDRLHRKWEDMSQSWKSV